MSTERRIDPKGRVTIPKEIRDRLAIEPGASVEVTIDNGRIVIQRDQQHDGTLSSLRGCLTAETKRDTAPEMDPLELKNDWTSDLPG